MFRCVVSSPPQTGWYQQWNPIERRLIRMGWKRPKIVEVWTLKAKKPHTRPKGCWNVFFFLEKKGAEDANSSLRICSWGRFLCVFFFRVKILESDGMFSLYCQEAVGRIVANMYVLSFAFIVNKQSNNFTISNIFYVRTNPLCSFLSNETIFSCPFTALVNLPIKVLMFYQCLPFKPSKLSKLNNRTIYGEWARVLSFFLGLILLGMGVLLLQPGCIQIFDFLLPARRGRVVSMLTVQGVPYTTPQKGIWVPFRGWLQCGVLVHSFEPHGSVEIHIVHLCSCRWLFYSSQWVQGGMMVIITLYMHSICELVRWKLHKGWGLQWLTQHWHHWDSSGINIDSMRGQRCFSIELCHTDGFKDVTLIKHKIACIVTEPEKMLRPPKGQDCPISPFIFQKSKMTCQDGCL